jgi:hypothetical protein
VKGVKGISQAGRFYTCSAKGARYDSQGQALSEAKRVAPGNKNKSERALKVRNIFAIIPLFQSSTVLIFYPGATRLALLGACPWLIYPAPLALRSLTSDYTIFFATTYKR